MMQDKGCGVVIMNQSNNFDKCLSKLKSTQFNKSDHDPIGILEKKIRRTLSLSFLSDDVNNLPFKTIVSSIKSLNISSMIQNNL